MRRRVAAAAIAAIAVFVLASPVARVQGQSPAPHVVFVTGDDEYRSEISMPMIARILEVDYGFKTSVAKAQPRPQTKDNIEGLDALASADLMVIYTRFRALPDAQVDRILAYVKSGKPVVGLRTSTHAFQYPKGHARESLNDGFGLDVLGQKWITHHGHESTTDVTIREDQKAHPILRGVTPFHASSWLYHVMPINGDGNTVLLDGTAKNSNKMKRLAEYPLTQPVAWTRMHSAASGGGARVFFTSLGHPKDFEHESMRRLLINGILWSLGRDVPVGGAKATPKEPYTAPETFDLSAPPTK